MLVQQRKRMAFWLILPTLLLILAFKIAPIIEGSSSASRRNR